MFLMFSPYLISSLSPLEAVTIVMKASFTTQTQTAPRKSLLWKGAGGDWFHDDNSPDSVARVVTTLSELVLSAFIYNICNCTFSSYNSHFLFYPI